MYLRIDSDGCLHQLLTGFLKAYNRRTDVMEASTDASIQKRIDELTADLKASTDTVQQAIKDDSKGGK